MPKTAINTEVFDILFFIARFIENIKDGKNTNNPKKPRAEDVIPIVPLKLNL